MHTHHTNKPWLCKNLNILQRQSNAIKTYLDMILSTYQHYLILVYVTFQQEKQKKQLLYTIPFYQSIRISYQCYTIKHTRSKQWVTLKRQLVFTKKSFK